MSTTKKAMLTLVGGVWALLYGYATFIDPSARDIAKSVTPALIAISGFAFAKEGIDLIRGGKSDD